MSDAMAQMRAVVEALYNQTIGGKVDWSLFNSNTYRAKIGTKHIEVAKENTKDDYYIIVSIYSGDGDLLDSVTDAYFGSQMPARTSHSNYFSLLKDLYDCAGRNARGADKAITSLLSDLGVSPIDPTEDDMPF